MEFKNKKEEFEYNKSVYQENKKKEEELEFNRIKELMLKGNTNHIDEYLFRQLHEKETLRRVYLSLVKVYPARISEIFEDSLLTKTTCYNQLFILMRYNICERIFVLDVVNGKIKNDEIKKKYEKWVENMPESLKRYYLAKASYFNLTDYGKKFLSKAWEFDNEFKNR